MNHFYVIKEALLFIDKHLDEEITFDTLANQFHFSAFYFRRMFTRVVGQSIAVYVRERRMQYACQQLFSSNQAIIHIALDCGYHSPQSFSRAFKGAVGFTPTEYRMLKISSEITPIDEKIRKFTNRLKGGIYLNPRIIKQKKLIIAGCSGAGDKTGEVWQNFEQLMAKTPLENKQSDNGYEIRLVSENSSTVHVGNAVTDVSANSAYTVMELPASTYAVFDVYVQQGYESENNAIGEWLNSNAEGYKEKLLKESHYCVEYYDERFNGSEAGSIVEIWIPIEKE